MEHPPCAVYSIQEQGGKCICLAGLSEDDQDIVIRYDVFVNSENKWWLQSTGEKYVYTLMDLNTCMYVNVQGGGFEDEANVIVYSDSTHLNTHWQLLPVEDKPDLYMLQELNFGQFLNHTVEQRGCEIHCIARNNHLPNSLWRFHFHSTLPDDIYTLQDVNGGRYLNVAGKDKEDGAWATTWSEGASILNSQWMIKSAGDKGVYTLQDVHGGKYLNSLDEDTDEISYVNLLSDPEQHSRKWLLSTSDGCIFTLKSLNTGKYLNVRWGSQSTGAEIIQWPDPAEKNSQWRLKRVDGTISLNREDRDIVPAVCRKEKKLASK